ncbi:hypothetical protein [Rhodococcus sp. IEGM 1341]|uniref:hypothetical protein n=1 Tax=Rhodococcus sp. IEGM 1341 TaxID=3047090 RepID=UPI0024B7125A|nr:hypothetical protein [Rhodococcus sp. IEGM 1341]MDI9928684.1 hypothetical protein [Rhodococcus sp. IEGM 1341]
MIGRSGSSDSERSLPEEQTFRAVLLGVCLSVLLFAVAFGVVTIVKAMYDANDITSNWFIAWGTWAGGLGTAAAFLIAAASISVSSAHTRFDRREAGRLRQDDEMAQARLLTIYKVEGELSLESLPTYRIENRSKDTFFDVSVPFVEAPNGADGEVEHRTAELVAKDNRLHEFIPSGEELTPYRDHTEDHLWFTLVTVHTTGADGVQFVVEYTDASGRRWRQKLGGAIERITTSEAVKIRTPDRFQPPQQVRRMTNLEAQRHGFTRGLKPLQTDAEFLEVLEARTVRTWKRIERVSDVRVVPNDFDVSSEGLIAEVTYRPAPPPFWTDHFHAKLAESDLHRGSSNSQYDRTDKFRLSPGTDIDAAFIAEIVDVALEYANDSFEQHELAAARRALEARSR